MLKSRAYACLIVLLSIIAHLPAVGADRISCYTTWDDRFFYMGVEVPDSNVISSNTTHMSNPWEDDCVEVFLETDNKRASDRSPNTFQMSVSAGGGSSFLAGENGQAVPKKIFTFKYAKKINGTLNRPIDRDTGYVIELAMPWDEMGGPPTSGQVMSFNIVCRMKGEDDSFVSLSPEVVSEEDIQVPAKWAQIKFLDTPTIIAIQDGIYICRKVGNRAPLVNGAISPGEWIRDMRVQMVKPAPPEKGPGEQFEMEKLALTHYFYWYQGDPRKEAPFSHVRYEDGSSALTTHPLSGPGPWFSYDRVQWHKDQLTAIADAGIDVALPVYWGAASNKRDFATKGLSCMVEALKELKAERKSYPLIGMFDDTSAMSVQYGEKPDLTDEEVKQTFYGMIKDFFTQVPDEFLATVQLPAERGGGSAYIIDLYTASWLSDFDGSFVEYCNKRFADDFGGRKLVWIGHSDFRSKGVTLDGYSDYGAGLGSKFDETGWIKVGAVGAGFDNSAVRGANTLIRSRDGGSVYKHDWDSVFGQDPDWMIVDGWNELHEGSEICPTSEYGTLYPGLTRINVLRFNGMRPFDAKFLKHDTPTVMEPGGLCQITLTIKNAGTRPWYPGLFGISVAARWLKDGMIFADSGVRLPLQGVVLAGDSIHRTIGVRAVDQDGNPLPEGDYELRWDLIRAKDEWFSDAGDSPLLVPVKVSSEPVTGFSLVGSTLPAMMKSGVTYPATVDVRNDGTVPVEAGAMKLRYRWQKVSTHLGAESSDSEEFLSGGVGEVDMPALEPGRVASVEVPVSAVAEGGVPLPVWTQNDLWTYAIVWDIVRADGEQLPIRFGREAVKVLADDYGPLFVNTDTPNQMTAGKQQKVTVTVYNVGTEVWTKGDFAVGYHWYYLDGTEAVWEGEKTSLRSDVQPGDKAVVKTTVTPPMYDGQYHLVWDLAHGDKWVSTLTNSRGGDMLVLPILVVNGKLVAQDLSQAFDADIVSFDTSYKDGDADGTGLTFPAELLPPLVTEIAPDQKLWPSGLWTASQGTGLESSKRIGFRYPAKKDGANNAVTCAGQTIDVTPGRYAAIHLLAMSADDSSGVLTMGYKTGQSSQPMKFSAWDAPPKNGEQPGFVCLHRHSLGGDQKDQRCYINHYLLEVDSAAELTSITLPNEPSAKIMAITLEKAE